jgi:small neutral amino acid transporter SnatA (MarC family)
MLISEIITGVIVLAIGLVLNYFAPMVGERTVTIVLKIVGVILIVIGVVLIIAGVLSYPLGI